MSAGATTVLLKKRERTQNWIPEEKNALFALIKIHINAIENKKIDAAASAMKSFAWQQIYRAFRGRFSSDRDITRIREQWRRMKAQAKMEMYTFAEKVRTVGPEEATKSRPSHLSIEIWRLMESLRRSDCDIDHSDDSCQENSMNLHVILDKLTSPHTSETSTHEIKTEDNNDTYGNMEDENNSHGEFSQKESDIFSKKRPRMTEDESTIEVLEQKMAEQNMRNELLSSHKDRLPDSFSDKGESVHGAIWIFESAQREHEIKLRMLHIELERAELQKQTAINELKISEIKRQLIESQATEYYSQVRMAGERGSGAGKGGGSGGAIRDAGGSFGKMEAAHEDQYFYNLQKEQIKKMQESLHDEISFHEEQIKRHQEAINRHKKRITEMDKKE